MSLPGVYIRPRDNGAQVFRVDTENRHGRLDLLPLAQINLKTGEIRPQGGRTLTEAEAKTIDDWVAEAKAAARRQDEAALRDTLDRIGRTAHWVQTKATDGEIDAYGDTLLLAIHDLRSAIVRRRASRGEEEAPGKAG